MLFLPVENDVGKLVVLGDGYAKFSELVLLQDNMLLCCISDVEDGRASSEPRAELLNDSHLELVVSSGG